MGLFGFPMEVALFYRNYLDLKVFVETGTYYGNTAAAVSRFFEKVYTVEKSEKIYQMAKNNLKTYSNVNLLLGDSRDFLKDILEKEDSVLLWLDAHWSGGETYGENDECPIIEELEVVFKSKKKKVIMVDDARLFLAPPPKPHNIAKWPSIREIINLVPIEYEVLIHSDVIHVFGRELNEPVKHYFQELTTGEWRRHSNPMYRILRRFIKT